MKIRNDFVTNSSSSSFIISRNQEVTEKQKDAILKYVLSFMLGRENFTMENLDELCEENGIWDDDREKIEGELKKGNMVSLGRVYFEETDYILAAMYKDLWDVLEKADPENFTQIKTQLDY